MKKLSAFPILALSVSVLLQAGRLPGAARAADIVLQSTPQRVGLLELYTSEGCSSCPPAEAWLSTLKQDPGLWKNYVPVNFHVTYWDNLGWPDRYAAPEYTTRQYAFAASWHSQTVYTPEFILNGQEWQRYDVPVASAVSAGVLQATLDGKRNLALTYTPVATGKKWEAHVALLGFDLDTSVRAGENSGLTLHHDFVVLSLQDLKLGDQETSLALAAPRPGEKAIAIWVTEENQVEPVQTVGGWLK
jgi:hypothetical protein